jgi:hypothetical protein
MSRVKFDLSDYPSFGCYWPNRCVKLTKLAVEDGLYTNIISARVHDNQWSVDMLPPHHFSSIDEKSLTKDLVIKHDVIKNTIHNWVYQIKKSTRSTNGNNKGRYTVYLEMA